MAGKKLSVDLTMNSQGFKQGSNEVIAQTNKLTSSTRDYVAECGTLRKQFREAQRAAQNLAVQYNDLSKAQKESEIGQEIRENMEFAIKKAAELKDVMSDTQEAIAHSASDTKTFDAWKQGFDVIGDAALSAVGAITYFTGESEDLNRALGAWMAIEKGLCAVTKLQNALQKQSYIILRIKDIQTWALTKAELAQTAATGKATIAQRIFNAVAKANPYVLLATAIVAVCGAIGTFIALTNKSAAAQAYEEEMLDAKEKSLQAYNDTFTKSYAEGIAGYRELENAWKQMKGTHQETEWLNKSAKKFNEYGANVKTAADVDKFFAQQGRNVIDSLKKRAIAEAKVAQAKELYTKSVELQMKAEAKQAEARAMAAMDQAKFMKLSTNPVENIVEIFNLGDTVKKRQEAMVNEVKNIAASYKAMSSQFQRLGDNIMESVNWSDYNWGKFEPDTSVFKNIKEKAKANGKTIAKTYKEELEQAVNDIQKQLYDLKPTPKNEEKKLKLQADLQTAQKQLEDFQIWTGEKTIPLKFSDDWFDEQMSMAKKLQSAVEYGSEEWKQLNNKITELNNIHIQITAEINKEEIQKSINEIVQNGIKPIEIKVNAQHDFSLLNEEDSRQANLLLERLNQLQDAYDKLNKKKEESKDTITAEESAKGMETLQKEIDKTNESLQAYDEKQIDAEKHEKWQDKINDRSDAWSSYGQILSGVGQAIGAVSDSQEAQVAAFAVNTAGMLADMVSRIAALQAETMAEGAASVFDLPFPANIAAWATVAATIGSIFAALPKFAEGGIVPGGSYSGDKVLSALNSGEGVLTRQGVANLNKLYNNINSPTIISGTQKVEFVIKGKNLVGTMGNYEKQQNKII